MTHHEEASEGVRLRVRLMDGRTEPLTKNKKSNPIKNYTAGAEKRGQTSGEKIRKKSRQHHAATCNFGLPPPGPGVARRPPGVDAVPAAAVITRRGDIYESHPRACGGGGGSGRRAWRNFSTSPGDLRCGKRRQRGGRGDTGGC